MSDLSLQNLLIAVWASAIGKVKEPLCETCVYGRGFRSGVFVGVPLDFIASLSIQSVLEARQWDQGAIGLSETRIRNGLVTGLVLNSGKVCTDIEDLFCSGGHGRLIPGVDGQAVW